MFTLPSRCRIALTVSRTAREVDIENKLVLEFESKVVELEQRHEAVRMRRQQQQKITPDVPNVTSATNNAATETPANNAAVAATQLTPPQPAPAAVQMQVPHESKSSASSNTDTKLPRHSPDTDTDTDTDTKVANGSMVATSASGSDQQRPSPVPPKQNSAFFFGRLAASEPRISTRSEPASTSSRGQRSLLEPPLILASSAAEPAHKPLTQREVEPESVSAEKTSFFRY